MTILVTGSNGQLGTHIRIRSARSRHQYLFTDVENLDITDYEAVRQYVDYNHIEVIVNCAAYTNVDRAESDEEAADKVNNVAVGHLAKAMAMVGGLLVHVSTDYVFGGNFNNTPCGEDEAPNPTGVYGRTKLLGEQAIVASGCRHLLFRTSWLYSEYGKNFCKTMLALTAAKPSLTVVFDQVGTPTYAGDLAKAIVTILENDMTDGKEGLYHYSNEGGCSWYDFAKEIARQSGHSDCDIQPCHSNEYPSPVVRPSYSVLDKTKFKQTFGIRVPYWTDSLAVCLHNIKQIEK
jgi:dTDP-4-dehydrorhamnose reductase